MRFIPIKPPDKKKIRTQVKDEIKEKVTAIKKKWWRR